jgi:hypothetical protein
MRLEILQDPCEFLVAEDCKVPKLAATYSLRKGPVNLLTNHEYQTCTGYVLERWE